MSEVKLGRLINGSESLPMLPWHKNQLGRLYVLVFMLKGMIDQ